MQMCEEVAAGFFCCLHVSKAKNYTKRKKRNVPEVERNKYMDFFWH